MLARPSVTWRVKSCSHMASLSIRFNVVGEMQRQDVEIERVDEDGSRLSSSKPHSIPSFQSATWDASYGIVFGPPSLGLAECFPTPRTFRRYLSDQSRMFSSSAIASAPSVPPRPTRSQRPSRTPRPNPMIVDSDPFASLNPQMRPLAPRADRDARGLRDGKAPKCRLEPIIQIATPVRDLLPMPKEHRTKLQNIERVKEQIADGIIDPKLVNITRHVDNLGNVIDDLVKYGEPELQKIEEEVRSRRESELRKIIDRRYKGAETMAEEIWNAIHECRALCEEFMKEFQHQINELKNAVKMVKQAMEQIEIEITEVQGEFTTWNDQKQVWAEQTRQQNERLRGQFEQKWVEIEDSLARMNEAYAKIRVLAYNYTDPIQRTVETALGESVERSGAVLDPNDDLDSSNTDDSAIASNSTAANPIPVQAWKLSYEHRKRLKSHLELWCASVESLRVALHEFREMLQSQVHNNSEVLEPEIKRLFMWQYYREESTSGLSIPVRIFDRQIRQCEKQQSYDAAFQRAMSMCNGSYYCVVDSHKMLMERIHQEYCACQSPVYRSLLDYDQAFGYYYQRLPRIAKELRQMRTCLPKDMTTLRKMLSDGKGEMQSGQLEGLHKDLLCLHVWDQKLRHRISNEKPNTNDQPATDETPHVKLGFVVGDGGARLKARLEDTEIEIFERLEKRYAELLISKGPESWIANTFVWEILQWDVSVRTLNELGSDGDTNPFPLRHVLLCENLITSVELNSISATKGGLLRVSAKLKQLSQDSSEGVRLLLPRDLDQRLLEDVYHLLEMHNDCMKTLAEQAKLPWISDGTRKDLIGLLHQCIGARNDCFNIVWSTLLVLVLDRQGLDFPLRYQTEFTTRILSARSQKQPSFERRNQSILAFQSGERTKAAYWDCSQYRGPGNRSVKIHYCSSLTSTERTIQKYFENEPVLGFDMEWKANASSSNSRKDNVSMIQMAGESRIGLFHIARFKGDSVKDLVGPSLKHLMESPSIIKTGVNIKADCTRLRKHLDVDSKGLFELSHLHKLVKFFDNPAMINKRPAKLSDQVEEHLGLPLWKGDVRTSDWTRKLETEQTLYAASDPYACFHLYHVLESKRKALDPMPPCPELAEKDAPICLANGQPASSCKKAVKEDKTVEPIMEDDAETDSDSSSSLDWETELLVERSIVDEDRPSLSAV